MGKEKREIRSEREREKGDRKRKVYLLSGRQKK